ncbi:MAG: hypothetical protein LBC87_06180, partial [Fibromonadaceae bacterium]|nr:hypothetical protein [Fibromonadaceae bacterium]
EEKERLKEEQRLKEEERQREEQRLKEEQQKIIAEEQKLKAEKERLTGKLRVITEVPQEEVAKEAPQEAPQEIAEKVSKEDEKSIFGEPEEQKKKKGCFLYFIIIIFILAIVAYFAKPYYIDIYYDYIGEKPEKENDNAVVEADTLKQNPEQNLGVSDSTENPSDTTVAKEEQDSSKNAKKTEAAKKTEPPKKRTEAEKQTDDDVAQAIAAVLKSEKSEPEPAPKPVSEPKSKAKAETVNKGNFYKTSFNCEKTNHETVLLICTNEELAKLDMQLNKLYQPLKLAYEEEQKEWRKTLGKCRVDVNCLDKMYRDRIKVLKEAQ